jgi:sortase A
VTPGRRRKRVRRAVFGGLLASGAAFLIAGFWIPAKAEVAQWLLNRAWTASRADLRPARPWPWADTWPVARLHLPRESRPLTVLAGTSGRNLAFGPALMDGSAMPGEPGVSVIAGHRDTALRALEDVALGDRFEIELANGAAYEYEVTALDVVDTRESRLRLDAEESVVVLVTCFPFDAPTAGGALRYVVVGRARD